MAFCDGDLILSFCEPNYEKPVNIDRCGDQRNSLIFRKTSVALGPRIFRNNEVLLLGGCPLNG